MHVTMFHCILSTCGTSLLTNSSGLEERCLITLISHRGAVVRLCSHTLNKQATQGSDDPLAIVAKLLALEGVQWRCSCSQNNIGNDRFVDRRGFPPFHGFSQQTGNALTQPGVEWSAERFRASWSGSAFFLL